MKRLFDFVSSFLGLLILSPIIILFIILVFLQDYKNPFYVAPRVGKNGKTFSMIKLRSMVMNADKSGVDSTSANDMRITKVGHFIRRYKIDELSQLFNVLFGTMSLVGPRPQVQRDVDIYTDEENLILTVKPGITDFSSIVFSDEGEILKDASDPDLKYNQVIRPWKSRFCIFYIENNSLLIDIQLIFLTVLAILNKKLALEKISKLLTAQNADDNLIRVSKRQDELQPFPPPGATEIVSSRNI